MLEEEYWDMTPEERLAYGREQYLRHKEMTEWQNLFAYGKIPSRPKYQSKYRWRTFCLKVKDLHDNNIIVLKESE